jgi:hypothetical protein
VFEVAVGTVGDVPFVHEVYGLDIPPDFQAAHGYDHGPCIFDRGRVAGEPCLLVGHCIGCGDEQETSDRQRDQMDCGFLHGNYLSVIGNSRTRVPVAAKIAFVIAGATGGNGPSPSPLGASLLSTR